MDVEVAILLTVYNRKEKTLACLKAIEEQVFSKDVHLNIFLTDDASTDGTGKAITKQFPHVRIFHGTGGLFWAGGMRNSWNEALKSAPDYYLLLNDDTVVLPGIVESLLENTLVHHKKHGIKPLLVGSTKFSDSDAISYGGRKLYSDRSPKSYQVYSPTETLECDLTNANILWVPREIVDRIGILSPEFTHGIADFDYALRAKKEGFPVLVNPGILGICTNEHGNNWKSHDVSLRERIRFLYSPKGLAYKEYLIFVKRHFPGHVFEAKLKLWVKTLFPIIYDRFK